MTDAPPVESFDDAQSEVSPATPTLEGLLAKWGRREIPADLLPALRLAVGAHLQRVQDGVADRPALNRSTALWALLVTDPDSALAAAEGHLDAGALRTLLGITIDPAPPAELPSPLPLDHSLAAALDNHVGPSNRDHLDSLAVMTAILESCQRPGGMLPRRLDAMSVERAAALDALAARRAGRPAGFSASVRQARRALGPDTEHTAADLVTQLVKLHPSVPMASITSLPRGAVARTDEWLIRVAELYDSGDVLRSSRGIVDAELVLRGLIELDSALAATVEQHPETMHWVEGIRPSPAAERHTEPSADVPAAIDLLGRETLATTLLRQLELIGRRGESSMLVHLDGPWGSGKSSLFGFLKRAMVDGDSTHSSSRGTAPRYLVVEVNAWREQRLGAQWWTLYRALRVAHLNAAGSRWRRLGSRIVHLMDVISVRRDKLWPVALALAVLIVGTVLVLRFGLDSGLGLPEILTVAAALTGGLTAAYRFLVPVSPRSARALEENSTNPMGEVRELFARSVRRAAPRRVVFLIDDLDRCEPAYVIKFLEVVQTLVRDAPCDDAHQPRRMAPKRGALGPYAVIAADGLWLRSCYEKTYSDLMHDDTPGRPLGYRFLEKIFQMHIRLPNVEAATKRRYYESLLFPTGRPTPSVAESDMKLQRSVSEQIRRMRTTEDLSELNDSISRIADGQTQQNLRASALDKAVTPVVVQRQLHELTPFADLLDANPRTIRLFVNAVSMHAYLRFLEGSTFELSGLALWAVLEARWPALADHLRDHPEHVAIASEEAATAAGFPLELYTLLTRPEVARVLHNKRWGDFTPERIRACTGGV